MEVQDRAALTGSALHIIYWPMRGLAKLGRSHHGTS